MKTPLKRARTRELLRTLRRLEAEGSIEAGSTEQVQSVDDENARLKQLLEFYSAGMQSKKMAISECLKTIDALSLESFPLYGAYSRDVEDTLIKVREILKVNWGQDYGIEIRNTNKK